MLLATTTVEDFDRFTSVFSTTSLEKRKQHGSKGAHVFRDPNQEDRVWVIFDWERVQLHPYFTERSFAHAPALAPIGELAAAHHERLNGNGYHRKTLAPGLGRAARILAAADSYQAMRERRPHRAALEAHEAEAELLRDAQEGRLCPEAVDAVLAAAGHRVVKRPRQLPARLTERELDVLLALASGKSNKEIAEALAISVKTAGHHIQHIFDKTGARTRSAATVWAFEHHLVQSD